jgi:predicted RNase H-like HicB family nuclease
MEYTILIHQAEEGGFWSEVPALPGCYSQSETIDETLHNTKEAIESYLIALKEDRLEAPIERTFSLEGPGGSCRLVIPRTIRQ